MPDNILLIGRILQKFQLITAGQFEEVVRTHEQGGGRPSIHELLQDRGYLTREQAAWLAQAVRHYEAQVQRAGGSGPTQTSAPQGQEPISGGGGGGAAAGAGSNAGVQATDGGAGTGASGPHAASGPHTASGPHAASAPQPSGALQVAAALHAVELLPISALPVAQGATHATGHAAGHAAGAAPTANPAPALSSHPGAASAGHPAGALLALEPEGLEVLDAEDGDLLLLPSEETPREATPTAGSAAPERVAPAAPPAAAPAKKPSAPPRSTGRPAAGNGRVAIGIMRVSDRRRQPQAPAREAQPQAPAREAHQAPAREAHQAPAREAQQAPAREAQQRARVAEPAPTEIAVRAAAPMAVAPLRRPTPPSLLRADLGDLSSLTVTTAVDPELPELELDFEPPDTFPLDEPTPPSRSTPPPLSAGTLLSPPPVPLDLLAPTQHNLALPIFVLPIDAEPLIEVDVSELQDRAAEPADAPADAPAEEPADAPAEAHPDESAEEPADPPPEELAEGLLDASADGGEDRPAADPAQALAAESALQLVREAFAAGASDLHLHTGRQPMWRVDGVLHPVPHQPPLPAGTGEALLAALLPAAARDRLAEQGQVLFASDVPDHGRVRGASVVRTEGPGEPARVDLVLRLLPGLLPSLSSLGLPALLDRVPEIPSGLLLCAGKSGSGKSTTLAALLARCLAAGRGPAFSIEDPIELRQEADAQLTQLEVRSEDQPEALRGLLRQPCDVVALGDISDAPRALLALQLAATGRLVIAVLPGHAGDTAGALHGLLALFPESERTAARAQLGECLVAVLAQRLVRRAHGAGRLLAAEILLNSLPLLEALEEEHLPALRARIHLLGRRERQGVLLFADHLDALRRAGLISDDEADAALRDLPE